MEFFTSSLDQKIDSYRNLAGTHENNSLARLGLAESLLRRGFSLEALSHYSDIYKRYPYCEEAGLGVSYCFLVSDKIALAYRWLLKVLNRFPASIEGRILLERIKKTQSLPESLVHWANVLPPSSVIKKALVRSKVERLVTMREVHELGRIAQEGSRPVLDFFYSQSQERLVEIERKSARLEELLAESEQFDFEGIDAVPSLPFPSEVLEQLGIDSDEEDSVEELWASDSKEIEPDRSHFGKELKVEPVDVSHDIVVSEIEVKTEEPYVSEPEVEAEPQPHKESAGSSFDWLKDDEIQEIFNKLISMKSSNGVGVWSGDEGWVFKSDGDGVQLNSVENCLADCALILESLEGASKYFVVEFKDWMLFLASLSRDSFLVIIGSQGAQLGTVRYALERYLNTLQTAAED